VLSYNVGLRRWGRAEWKRIAAAGDPGKRVDSTAGKKGGPVLAS
jgi:hypothetical protein